MKVETSGLVPFTPTRRDLLAAGLGGFGLVVTSGCDIQSGQMSEFEKMTDSRRIIERKFPVKLYSQKEFDSDSRSNPDDPLPWTQGQLSMMEEFLELVPSHMIVPREGSKKLRYINADLGDSHSDHIIGGECCAQKTPNGYAMDVITFNSKSFVPGAKDRSKKTFVHEHAHRITPWNKIDDDIFNKEEEIWMDALGDIFHEPSREKINEVLQKHAPRAKTNAARSEDHFSFAYGLKNVEEFIAVMAQNYPSGRSFFIRMYSPYFGKAGSEQLLEFTTDIIFRGKKYH